MSDQATYKKKKEVLVKVFNFPFLSALTPKIADIFDDIFDKLEEGKAGGELEEDVLVLTTEVAGRIVCECFFGEKYQN